MVLGPDLYMYMLRTESFICLLKIYVQYVLHYIVPVIDITSTHLAHPKCLFKSEEHVINQHHPVILYKQQVLGVGPTHLVDTATVPLQTDLNLHL